MMRSLIRITVSFISVARQNLIIICYPVQAILSSILNPFRGQTPVFIRLSISVLIAMQTFGIHLGIYWSDVSPIMDV